MSLLGKFTKQPVEVEIYAINFFDDLSATDSLVSAWQIMARSTAANWDQVVQATTYTALLSDAERILVCLASVTLPTGASDGYRIYVTNQHTSGISVGAFNVPALGSIVVARAAGVWVVEGKANAILVSTPTDERVRTTVYGGTVGQTYKLQVAVTTSEGRVLQDEFTVKIKEV